MAMYNAAGEMSVWEVIRYGSSWRNADVSSFSSKDSKIWQTEEDVCPFFLPHIIFKVNPFTPDLLCSTSLSGTLKSLLETSSRLQAQRQRQKASPSLSLFLTALNKK